MSRHLSPTTFIRYRKCPHQVKLDKIDRVLGEDRGEQTLPMATGNLFDIAVKSHINRRIDKQKEMELKVPNKVMRRSALLVVNELWKVYSEGSFKSLQEEGVGYVGIDQEVLLSFTPICKECDGKKWHPSNDYSPMTACECQYKEKKYESLLYGMPDLVLKDGTVIDWKVSGAFGRGATPQPGYKYEYRGSKRLIGEDDPPPMTKINEDWAIQLYLYSRLLGHKPGDPLKGGIEQICVSGSDVRCVSYRSPIPSDWQLKIEEEFHQAYHNLFGGGTVPQPHYHGNRCIQYGKFCAVAQFCHAWKRFQEFKDS